MRSSLKYTGALFASRGNVEQNVKSTRDTVIFLLAKGAMGVINLLPCTYYFIYTPVSYIWFCLGNWYLMDDDKKKWLKMIFSQASGVSKTLSSIFPLWEVLHGSHGGIRFVNTHIWFQLQERHNSTYWKLCLFCKMAESGLPSPRQ